MNRIASNSSIPTRLARIALVTLVAGTWACNASSDTNDEGAAAGEDGLGLDDGQTWRIELRGDEALAGTHVGKTSYVLREGNELSLSFQGSATGLVITLSDVPVGQTKTLTAETVAFYATLEGIDCSTANGGSVEVTLTRNDADHVSGRFAGKASCKQPPGTEATWKGVFDYQGKIDGG